MKSTIFYTAVCATLLSAQVSMANSSNDSWEASKNMASQFATAVGQSGKDSWNMMGDLAQGSGTVATGAYNGTKTVVLKSWEWSGEAFTAVFTWSKDSSAGAADIVVKGAKGAYKMAANSSTASAEMTDKWVIKPIAKGIAVLTNGSQQIWVASTDVLRRIMENAVETDLTQYENQ